MLRSAQFHPNPETTANYFSKIFFIYLIPFIKKALKHGLDEHKLFNTTMGDMAQPLFCRLDKQWGREVESAHQTGKDPSLSRALIKSFFGNHLYFGICLGLQAIILRLLPPILSTYMIYVYKFKELGFNFSLYIGCFFVFVVFINVCFFHHVMLGCHRIGMRCRIACNCLIYRKLLKLDKDTLDKQSSEKIIGLFNETAKFEMAAVYFHYLWITPLQIVIIIGLTTQVIGWLPLPAILTMFLFTILMKVIMKQTTKKYQVKMESYTKMRSKYLSEMTNNIRLIKIYGCEEMYRSAIYGYRQSEMRYLKRKMYLFGLITMLFSYSNRLGLLVYVLTRYLTSSHMACEVIFPMSQYLVLIQLFLVTRFPIATDSLMEANHAINNIQKFLLLPERKRHYPEYVTKGKHSGYISFAHIFAGDVSHARGARKTSVLENINVEITPGSFVVIVGGPKSGKTAFLEVILQELHIISGKVRRMGRIAYCAQEPFLFNGSIRNNILFGEPFFQSRYKDVTRVCAVQTAIVNIPNYDKALVELIPLDDHQKALIHLARSVYRDAEIYLFDEPFNTLSRMYTRQIIEQCLLEHLESKTRIVVTNHLFTAKEADLVIVMKDGRIVGQGTFSEVSKLADMPDLLDFHKSVPDLTSVSAMDLSINESETDDDQAVNPTEKSGVTFNTYLSYLRVYENCFMKGLFYILLFVIQLTTIVSDFWLISWVRGGQICANDTIADYVITPVIRISEDDKRYISSHRNESTVSVVDEYFDCRTHDDMNKMIMLVVYTGSVLFMSMLVVLLICFHCHIQFTTAKNLHNQIVESLSKIPMDYFYSKQAVNVGSHVAKDCIVLDEALHMDMLETMLLFFIAFSIFVTVSILFPIMIVFVFLLLLAVYYIRRIYTVICSELGALVLKSRAPIHSYVASTVAGMTTIRCYKSETTIVTVFDDLQNNNTKPFVLMILMGKMFGFYIDISVVIFFTAIIVQSFVVPSWFLASGCALGYSIAETMYLVTNFQHALKCSTKISTHMGSAERLFNIMKIPEEGPYESDPVDKPPDDWPDEGAINFRKVYQLNYYSVQEELFSFSFDIKSGDKIALMGRRGCGKLSVVSALFYLNDFIGDVTIDDFNLFDIGLHELRKKISIIPMVPAVFSFSIRNNVDIDGARLDADIWSVLEMVGLSEKFASLEVMADQISWSDDELHLLSLARVLLQKNRILVYEETSQRISEKTRSIIREMFDTEFNDYTILLLPQTLSMAAIADFIVIMEKGKIIRLATLHTVLVTDPDSYMLSLFQDLTPTEQKELLKLAMEKKIALEESRLMLPEIEDTSSTVFSTPSKKFR